LRSDQRRSATLLSLCRSISAPWRWSEPMNEIEPPTLRFSDTSSTVHMVSLVFQCWSTHRGRLRRHSERIGTETLTETPEHDHSSRPPNARRRPRPQRCELSRPGDQVRSHFNGRAAATWSVMWSLSCPARAGVVPPTQITISGSHRRASANLGTAVDQL
jgi:hypothetical protein